jgi:hypothetical protein
MSNVKSWGQVVRGDHDAQVGAGGRGRGLLLSKGKNKRGSGFRAAARITHLPRYTITVFDLKGKGQCI